MADSNMNGKTVQDNENNAISLRILVSGPEILSLVNHFGDGLRRILKESGAKINISEGSVPDRIVSVSGSFNAVYNAVRLIVGSFEQFLVYSEERDIRKNPLTLKLLVPAAQCGPLIGKGGSKIREIRERTGAVIQVGIEVLPNCGERIVTVTGRVDPITDCAIDIANVVNTRNPVALYQPWADAMKGPVLFSDGRVYSLQGTLAIPVDNDLYDRLMNNPKIRDYVSKFPNADFENKQFGDNRNAGYITDVMWVNDDFVESIVGDGGSKIEEIRQITGSVVTIMNETEQISPDIVKRKILVQGTNESVTLAKYLVSLCMELEMVMSRRGRPDTGLGLPTITSSTPVLESLAKSGILNNLSAVTNTSTINDTINSLGISGLFAPAYEVKKV